MQQRDKEQQRQVQRQADWFLPAIVHNGSVEESLAMVTTALAEKTKFVEQLNQHLCLYRGRSSDSLSELQRRTRELRQTLSFRLGMLRPDQEGAWFRTGITAELGPFPVSLLAEPVFLAFEASVADILRQQLTRAWRDRRALELPFKVKGPCLWLTLLDINQAWENVVKLEGGLRLDSLPDHLPTGLDSPLLRAFLINVRLKALDVRRELDECYEALEPPSRGFLERQARLAPAARMRERSSASAEAKTAQQASWQAEAGGNPSSARYRQSAESMREKFRERRQGRQTWGFLSEQDRAALLQMEFDELPDLSQLKKRYRDLARRLHPDTGAADEQAFQHLSSAYQYLTKRLRVLSSSPDSF